MDRSLINLTLYFTTQEHTGSHRFVMTHASCAKPKEHTGSHRLVLTHASCAKPKATQAPESFSELTAS